MTTANKLSPSEIPARVAGICASPSRTQSKKGFTLIELLICVGIIAVVAGVVSPFFFSAGSSEGNLSPREKVKMQREKKTTDSIAYVKALDERQQEIAQDVEGNKGEIAALRNRLSKLEAEFAKYREMNPLPAEAPQRRNVPAPVPTPR